ncbi:MAG: hypothetical protein ACR5LG_08490 [Sodalis sp. (in: enterobacteria)]|uniref:hypothetical protein n=1 Tax=Sodalis sp. (in: enterobacteria) TaxID=1898979 RepID=UPI003F37940D
MHYDDGIKYFLLPSTSSPLVQQKRLAKIIPNLMINNDLCRLNYEFMLYIFYNFSSSRQQTLLNQVFIQKQNAHRTLRAFIGSTKFICTYSEMLRTEPGRLIIFTRADDTTFRHWMISLGNSRFAGMNNMKIAAHLGEDKRVLLAEQLREFKDNLLHPRGANYGFSVTKHTFMESAPERSLLQVAKELLKRSNTASERL